MAGIIRVLSAIDAAAGVFTYEISGDPTSGAGIPAVLGSTAVRYDGSGATAGEGARYVKTSAPDTGWTLISAGAP